MGVASRDQWTRLLLGFAAVCALFQWSALSLGSNRGEAGVLVAALVVGALLAVERAWSGQSVWSAARAIGLGRPSLRGLVVSVAVCGLLLLAVAVHARWTGSTVTVADGALWLLPGLFAQAGIAEETLFRGYLFGHLRVGRTFWRAATLSMPPFAGVHLTLFVTLPFGVALAALALAVVMSFPLARLYEPGGETIWAPALLHFFAQATVKVLVVAGEGSPTFPFIWMVASAVLPLLALLIGGPRRAL